MEQRTKKSDPISYLWYNGPDPRRDKDINFNKKNEHKIFNFTFIPDGDLIEMAKNTKDL